MSITTEVSHDQQDWMPYERGKTRIEEYQYIRSIDTADKSWSRRQIDIWLNEKDRQPGTRIEYTHDDGFSWVTFRRGRADDAARIFTLLQNFSKGYAVRAMTLTENSVFVTSQLNNILNSQPGMQNGPTPYQQLGQTPPKVRTEHRWVAQSDPRVLIYSIAKTKPPVLSQVSEIEHKIVLSMSAPNENRVVSKIGMGSLTMAPTFDGHVYELEPCISLPSAWLDVLRAHRKQMTRPSDWYWVESARLYDNEAQDISGGIFAMTVLSDKYYVENDTSLHASKIGSRWLIAAADAGKFIHNVNMHGGFARQLTNVQQVEPITEDIWETVTRAKEQLKHAIERRDPQMIATYLFECVDVKDKAVKEVEALIEIIQQARRTAIELISEEDGRIP